MSLDPPMLRLTDEELELFAAVHPAVAAPFLGRLDQTQTMLALEVAQRALFAHGLPRSVDGALLVPVQVVQMLELRRNSAATLLLIHVESVEHVRYVHDVGTAWLVEDLGPDGVHEFDLHERDQLTKLVTEVIAPDTLVAGHGPAVCVDPCNPPWGEVRSRLDATVWRPDRERGPLLGVMIGARGAWSTCSVPGDTRPVSFRPTDGSTVLQQVLALLADEPGGTMVG
ncbi:hypothetical protein [Calidifontibacter terrae]